MLPQFLALQSRTRKNCGQGTVVRGKYRVLSPSRGSFLLRKEPYLMKVFVLSKEGKPLMPTTPRRARVWLKAKRARIVRQDPFTIRLRFATKEHVQPAKVGVDTGSKDVGIAATTNGEVVFQAEVHLRDNITEKLRQ